MCDSCLWLFVMVFITPTYVYVETCLDCCITFQGQSLKVESRRTFLEAYLSVPTLGQESNQNELPQVDHISESVCDTAIFQTALLAKLKIESFAEQF